MVQPMHQQRNPRPHRLRSGENAMDAGGERDVMTQHTTGSSVSANTPMTHHTHGHAQGALPEAHDFITRTTTHLTSVNGHQHHKGQERLAKELTQDQAE